MQYASNGAICRLFRQGSTVAAILFDLFVFKVFYSNKSIMRMRGAN